MRFFAITSEQAISFVPENNLSDLFGFLAFPYPQQKQQKTSYSSQEKKLQEGK